MILALLEKRCKIGLRAQDIYVNVMGGIRVDEPAVDLAIAMAIVSNYKNRIIDAKTVFIGELGLTGEIRSINNFEKRVKEIEKMGYNKIYASKRQVDMLKESMKDIKIKLIGINTIDEAINCIING